MDPISPNENHGRPNDLQSQHRVLGDFELVRVLGRGGMGTVYEARQRSLDRIVAVKVLPEHFASSAKAVQRFQREAKAAAKLHHTHIIPIFARGEDSGVYFFAMEFIHGIGLNNLIAELRAQDGKEENLAETIPLERSDTIAQSKGGRTTGGGHRSGATRSGSTRLGSGRFGSGATGSGVTNADPYYLDIARHMAAVADALHYAHHQGVIHRDIKPHNLMLGEDGRIRVADFGLARLIEQPGVTMTGEVVGSPLYMAPELLRGGQGAADQRADIYSLGATMYEWLTLTPPFPGDTRESVISKILTEEPRPLRDINAGIPTDLETICLKAMEREPTRRYRTAGDLRDDIERYLESKTIKARRAGLLDRTRRFVARHQLAAVIAVALLGFGLMGRALLQTKKQVKQESKKLADLQTELNTNDEIPVERQIAPPPTTARKTGQPIGRVIDSILPIPGSTNLFGQAMESTQQIANSATTLLATKDPVDLDTVSTPEGIALRAARDLYGTLVPDDYFSDANAFATGTSKSAYELQQAHDPARRNADPATALVLVQVYTQYNAIDYDSLHLRTLLHSQLREYDKMAADAEQLISLRPKDAFGYVWHGLASFLRDDHQQSIASFEKAAASEAAKPWCETSLALVHNEMDLPAQYVSRLDAIITQSPNFVVALLARANSASLLDELLAANEYYSQVLAIEPQNAAVLVARGKNSARLRNFDDALQDYTAAQNMVGGSRTIMNLFLELNLRKGGRAADTPGPQNGDSTTGLKGTPPTMPKAAPPSRNSLIPPEPGKPGISIRNLFRRLGF